MSSLPLPPMKRESLNLRIKVEERGLIDRAAYARGKNRTDFILEAARAAAEEALLDQAIIQLNEKNYRAFLVKLDKTPKPNKCLQKTMQTSAPWDQV